MKILFIIKNILVFIYFTLTFPFIMLAYILVRNDLSVKFWLKDGTENYKAVFNKLIKGK